ncbi:MAG: WD domain, G-beta repeat [Methanobacterium sp. PtaU1.Bin242]|nr:MAG: WD domain, G-beta repeat [Methanobacterium sp. PtaU1.Bin242]
MDTTGIKILKKDHMSPLELEALKEELYLPLPIIGEETRKSAAKKLSQAILEGQTSAIEIMADAIVRSDNDEVINTAKTSLNDIPSPIAVESLCDYILINKNFPVEHIIINNGYKPANTQKRVLFYVITRQWQEYENLDLKQDRHLLKKAYQNTKAQIKERLLEVICENGKSKILEEILILRDNKAHMNQFSDPEWDSIITIFETLKRYDDLWDLIFRAPVYYSYRMFNILDQAGYQPPVTDQTIWETLKKHPYQRIILSAKEIQHQSPVQCLGFSLDGRFFATGDSGGLVMVTDQENFQLIKKIQYPDGVRCLGFSPDGRFLVSGCSDGLVRVVDVEDFQLFREIRHQNWVNCLAFSFDGQFLATASIDGVVKVVNTRNFQLIKIIQHRSGVRCLGFSPDGRFLVSGCSDGLVRVVDVEDFQLFREIRHQKGVNCLKFSSNEQLLAIGTYNTVELINTQKYQLNKRINHPGGLRCLGFSPDGRFLVTGGWDGLVRVFETHYFQIVREVNHQNWVNCLSFSPDGWFIATATSEGKLKISQMILPGSVNEVSGHDLGGINKLLDDETLSPSDKSALKFIQTIILGKLRFDVIIEEVPSTLLDRDVIIERVDAI